LESEDAGDTPQFSDVERYKFSDVERYKFSDVAALQQPCGGSAAAGRPSVFTVRPALRLCR
jgi:hypothetical protein